MRCFLFLMAVSLSAEPLVIGHRGCRALRPENTLPAFAHALEAGADMLELDVVVTKDNQLVVHHDLELEKRPVRGLTLRQVLAFDRGGTPSAGFPRQQAMPGVRIPKLEEVFAFAREKGARLMVETIAAPDVDPRCFASAIGALVRKYGLSSQLILQNFDHQTLRPLKEFNPAVGLVLLNPAKRLDACLGPANALGPRAFSL